LLDEGEAVDREAGTSHKPRQLANNRPALTVVYCSEDELAEHRQSLETIEKASGFCLWK
jgi:DNA polymerase-3 subunit epsilon